MRRIECCVEYDCKSDGEGGRRCHNNQGQRSFVEVWQQTEPGYQQKRWKGYAIENAKGRDYAQDGGRQERCFVLSQVSVAVGDEDS